MFKKKISLPVAILMTIAGIAVGFLAVSFVKQSAAAAEPISVQTLSSCMPDQKRLSGYEYIKPLLFADRLCESEKLAGVKSRVSEILNNYKVTGTIQTGSVYLRQLNQGDWISVGDPDKYFPGSLLKVPELITFFKMNEKAPGLLDRKVTYERALNLPKQAHIVSKSIEVGKTYTIKELLYYMIAYSDNNATMLLNQRMDLDLFSKVFTDLGIAKPDLTAKDIPITAKEYSYFLRVLYNASYLNIQDSEFCTELLSHSDFVQGMISGLPQGTKTAHKFGEAGEGADSYFSESGIIYVQNSPYLLTVMTKGKDRSALPAVISDISKKVFELINSI